jgi:hypothetical protein
MKRGYPSSSRGWIAKHLAPSLCFLVVLVAAREGRSQDSEYWTDQFGNRARLLGGAVVGSAVDLSAVFYNPGALALVENPEVLLAGNVFEYTSIHATGGDQNRGVDSSTFRLSPSLFAGELKLGALTGHRLAYSFLTRQKADNRFETRGEFGGEILPPGSSPAFVSGDLLLEQDIGEHWFGVTWAHRAGSRTGIGVTQFLAVRNQRARYQTTIDALSSAGEGAVAIDEHDFDYQHWRLLWKIGVATHLERWQIGVTVTTPSVGLWGSGSLGMNRAVVSAAGEATTVIATTAQQGVSSDFRSPFSIAFGASYPLHATRLHVSAEWFDRVAPFRILDSDPFTGQTSGETISTDFLYTLDPVFNVAFGVEHPFSEALKAYGSFRTDFSGAVPGTTGNVVFSRWDLYHLAAGATFKVNRSEFTAGAIAAFGGATSPIDPGLLLGDAIDSAETRFFRLTFILGFNFSFE